MVAGASGSSRRPSRASATAPNSASAGYADPAVGATPVPKSRAKARALALTQPPVTPEPGRHNRQLTEVPEETSTVEVEVCVAGQPAADTTPVQILPRWVIIEDPEEEEFKPEVVANYRRIVGNFIQLFELHELHLRTGEYFDHIQERERAFLIELENNGGDARGGPRVGDPAARGQ